uniref:G-protein coupled receptors family 1 profile domain-containing protein n=1 Tax=Plectus sambesii TaxID=2011161 RepID=A0A914WVS0_9BILA
MRLGGTSFESALYRYLFPPIFVIGVLGNVVNLCVLLSPTMRSRANNLLLALAFTDIAFLLAMLPHSMANYSALAMNYAYRFVYLHSKLQLTWLANWSSATAIWIVMAVCVDRRMGIKSPLYSRKDWSARKMAVVLLLIWISTGLLTSYNFFGFHCFRSYYCKGTQLYSICYSIASDRWVNNRTNPYSPAMREYVQMSIVANVFLVVVLPMIAMAALNAALLHELKKRGEDPLLKNNTSCCESRDRCQERKVAVTVSAIVCCFILTQGPSAITLVWNMANGSSPTTNAFVYNLRSAANFLVIVGKATNFFLFCFCSAHFRKRVVQLCLRRRKHCASRGSAVGAKTVEESALYSEFGSMVRDKRLTPPTTSSSLGATSI